jgi:hypothetical protein
VSILLMKYWRSRNTYSFIQTCIKFQAASAAVRVVLAVDAGSCEEKTPAKRVEFKEDAVAAEPVTFTVYGERVSSIVPLTNLSYENPVWTGWSIYSMFTSEFHDHGLRRVFLESAAT